MHNLPFSPAPPRPASARGAHPLPTRAAPGDRQPSVLHLLAPGEVGGLESVVGALAAGHRRRGDAVTVAATLAPDGPEPGFLRVLRDTGVEVVTIRVAGRAYLHERGEVARLCRRLRPAVVHSHGYRADLVGAPAARRLRIPTVTTVHGFTGGDWKNRVYEAVQRRAFRRFDAVVAVSAPLAERLAAGGVDRTRLRLIRNAWPGGTGRSPAADARAALGVAADRFHVGWVGRVSREKGLDVLVDALPFLRDLPVTVSVLGDGAERRAVEERAAALGVSGMLRWHGVVNTAARLFAGFDVLALSSRTEGTPMVLLEAVDAGVPVVASRVGGVPDVVGSEEALLVPPEDPRALAAALRRVYEETAAARARAEAARRRLAREFGAGPWLAAYAELYRNVQRTPQVEPSP